MKEEASPVTRSLKRAQASITTAALVAGLLLAAPAAALGSGAQTTYVVLAESGAASADVAASNQRRRRHRHQSQRCDRHLHGSGTRRWVRRGRLGVEGRLRRGRPASDRPAAGWRPRQGRRSRGRSDPRWRRREALATADRPPGWIHWTRWPGAWRWSSRIRPGPSTPGTTGCLSGSSTPASTRRTLTSPASSRPRLSRNFVTDIPSDRRTVRGGLVRRPGDGRRQRPRHARRRDRRRGGERLGRLRALPPACGSSTSAAARTAATCSWARSRMP